MTKSRVFLALSLALAAISAHADPIGDLIAANNEIGISLVRQNINYSEMDSTRQYGSATLDSETGTVPGYAITFSTMRDLWLGNDYLAAGFSREKGSTSYTGGYMKSGVYHPLSATSGADMRDIWLRAGHGFFVSDAAMITAYAELGSHTWNRFVGESTNMSYMENYKHLYAGAGLRAQYVPMDALVVNGDVFLGHTFNANITTPNMASAQLGGSAMYRLGVGLDYRVAGNAHITASYDVAHYEYGGSAVQPSGYFEPDSQTTSRTLSVGFSYGF